MMAKMESRYGSGRSPAVPLSLSPKINNNGNVDDNVGGQVVVPVYDDPEGAKAAGQDSRGQEERLYKMGDKLVRTQVSLFQRDALIVRMKAELDRCQAEARKGVEAQQREQEKVSGLCDSHFKSASARKNKRPPLPLG